jgi:predicted GNAT family acetyltransferase
MKEVSNASGTIEISLKEREAKGYAIARDAGQKIGLMTFSKPSESLIIIDHTEVDSAYQGRDVGMRLLTALVEDARERGRQVIPLCPFANAMFRKYEYIRDVLKN